MAANAEKKRRNPAKRKRPHPKTFWFSDDELAAFTANAEKVGIGLPEYMRLQTIQKAPRVKMGELDRNLVRQVMAEMGKNRTELSAIRAEAGHIRGLLNQVAYAAHLDRELHGLLQSGLNDVTAMIESYEQAMIDFLEIKDALLDTLGKRPHGRPE